MLSTIIFNIDVLDASIVKKVETSDPSSLALKSARIDLTQH